MPDKFEKYPINSKMIDEGWSQMNVILDREMPLEKKKRRILPIWFWSTGIAASILLGSFLLLKSTDTVPDKIKTISAKGMVPEPDANKEANVRTTENEINLNKETQSNIAANSTLNTNIAGNRKQSIKQSSSSETLAASGVNNLTEQSSNWEDLSTSKVSSPFASEGQSVDKPVSRECNFLHNLPGSPEIPAVTSNVENLALSRTFVKVKAPKSIQHAVFMRFNYTGLIDNGYSIGYLAKKSIANKQHLQGRLYLEKNTRFVHTVSQNFQLSRAIIDKSSFPGNLSAGRIDTAFSQVVYPYRENNALADIAEQNNVSGTYIENKNQFVILNAFHLGLGLSYGFQLTPRIELQAGTGLSYAVQHLEYGFQVGESLAKFENASTSNNPVSALDNKGNLPGLQTAIFSRYDGYYELGANFSVSRRVQVGAFYRKGLIDISKNDPLGKKDRNSFGVMQGIFYF